MSDDRVVLGELRSEAHEGRETVEALRQELHATKEHLHSALAQNAIIVEELRQRNAQLQVLDDDLVNILATVNIAIAIVDTQQRVRRFTPSVRTLLDLSPADVGRRITELHPNVGIDDLGGTIAAVIATLEMREAEVTDANGNAYRMQVHPYRSAGDLVSGAVISFVDITVLRRRIALEHERAQLARVEREAAEVTARERDAFLNAVSHELRGPLNAIVLWTSLLLQGELDHPHRQRALATIAQSAQAEAQLVDDLLELAASRSVSPPLAVEAEAIDPYASIAAALDAVRAEAQAKQVELVSHLSPQPRVRVDPRRLQQMTWHLANNAIKFTPSGGRVTISLTSSDSAVELAVEDTGQGISAELMPHVFEPFYRADTSTTRAQQGLGIGLALVRHLAERQGGSVAVRSAGVGRGSTFTLRLPFDGG